MPNKIKVLALALQAAMQNPFKLTSNTNRKPSPEERDCYERANSELSRKAKRNRKGRSKDPRNNDWRNGKRGR